MTREEFYAKYGNVKVKFSSYYKFTFTYKAELPDGSRLLCDYGGNSDDIYRHEFAANEEISVSDLQPYAGAVRKGKEEIEGFYEY